LLGSATKTMPFIGIEPLAAEAQLWVKDTLRGLVLPLPPFRARWIPTDGERGLLLVLVEESSTTPHLLTRSGAIYVRNPGSSDPVPITDQRHLLDLTARGERAAQRATSEARATLGVRLDDDLRPVETLTLAATGIASDFEERLFAPTTPAQLAATTWGRHSSDSQVMEWRDATWAQDYVGVSRYQEIPLARYHRTITEGLAVTRSGAIVIYRSYERRDPNQPASLSTRETEVRAFLGEALRAARQILLDHGAHGDLRLAFQLDPEGTRVSFETDHQIGEIAEPVIIEFWTTFDDDPATSDRIVAELRRAAHLAPLIRSSTAQR
jgi:hypothetical protein